MIQSFADDTAADIFRERQTKAARRIPKELWRIVQRKLKMLDVAARIDDLESPPGEMRGRCSIRVNEQYRVTFRWEHGHAFEVAVEDYH